MRARRYLPYLFLLLSFSGCKKEDVEDAALELNRAFIGATELNITGGPNENMPVDQLISLVFSSALNHESAANAISLDNGSQPVGINLNFSQDNKNVTISPTSVLANNVIYTISISDQLKGANGGSFLSKIVSFKTIVGNLVITAVRINDADVTGKNMVEDVPLALSMTFDFSFPVDEGSFENAFKLTGDSSPEVQFSYENEGRRATITGNTPLKYLTKYNAAIANTLKGASGEPFGGYAVTLYSELDETPKFPIISDEELLTKVQEQTFKYFWDFGHPVSGLTRERDTAGETIASGGSGFGIMAIIVGIERGFITRAEGITRLKTMVEFLEQSDRFHGAWPHWLNGTSGKVIPFSAKDDGGDLVETSYVIMGLLTLRQYLDVGNAIEGELVDKINTMVAGVEWNWYARGENVLTWHWSPNFGWDMNLKIRGWNEALITYVLAAASGTHGISTQVYEGGWKNSNHYENGKNFYNIKLPLGEDYGGPLFFEHYSFLGIDPRNLADAQVNYLEQAVNHTLINRQHCIVNPQGYIGYSADCWGLTASDGNGGYSAHSPTNDRGVITPTAALSSFPFTPEESMDAIKYFYYMLGDRLWGPYGFYDAFNITEGWYATSNIAIDQGPIIIMIENHRSGLLWNLFMSCPEVQIALDKLGFTY